MLRITVELISSRNGRITRLGQMDIYNTGLHPEHPKRGDYRGRLYNCKGKQMNRTGEVNNWPRQSYPIWRLICRMIKEMYPEEK